MATKPLEKRVSDLEEIIDDIPRLVNLRFSFIRAQLDTLEAKVDRLDQRMLTIEAEVKALPRVLAEMLDERAKRGGQPQSAYLLPLSLRMRDQTGEAHGRGLHL